MLFKNDVQHILWLKNYELFGRVSNILIKEKTPFFSDRAKLQKCRQQGIYEIQCPAN